ncbi:MAG TPA: hypothetical protein VGP36_05795 [Mycobacteriales bacterium]|jgi:hypothetical protein|nr:hypothetical protein [Mycobacteriales bacterium]
MTDTTPGVPPVPPPPPNTAWQQQTPDAEPYASHATLPLRTQLPNAAADRRLAPAVLVLGIGAALVAVLLVVLLARA